MDRSTRGWLIGLAVGVVIVVGIAVMSILTRSSTGVSTVAEARAVALIQVIAVPDRFYREGYISVDGYCYVTQDGLPKLFATRSDIDNNNVRASVAIDTTGLNQDVACDGRWLRATARVRPLESNWGELYGVHLSPIVLPNGGVTQ